MFHDKELVNILPDEKGWDAATSQTNCNFQADPSLNIFIRIHILFWQITVESTELIYIEYRCKLKFRTNRDGIWYSENGSILFTFNFTNWK